MMEGKSCLVVLSSRLVGLLLRCLDLDGSLEMGLFEGLAKLLELLLLLTV